MGGIEEPEEQKIIEYNNPEGSVIIIPKEKREMDYFTPPTKSKHKQQKGKLKKMDGSQTIKHNVMSFSLFEKLEMDPPVSTDELPTTIQNLQKQLAEYKAEIAVWEAKREEVRRIRLEQKLEKARVLQALFD